MDENPFLWINGLWIVFIAIWALAAVKTKRTARRRSGWQRCVQLGLSVLGLILLFDRRLSAGWLNSRFLPDMAAVAWAGVTMTAGGIAFAVWARFALGRNWSSQVALKQGHELVRSGPYRLVRHPIYSGVLLALLGTGRSHWRTSGIDRVRTFRRRLVAQGACGRGRPGGAVWRTIPHL